MKCLIIGICFALAQASYFEDFRDFFNTDNKYDYTIDYVHNYRFEDHETEKGPHLIVAISDFSQDKTCHIIEVGAEWEDYLKDKQLIKQLSEEIYHLIKTHTGKETDLLLYELLTTYGDSDSLQECFQHKLYLLTYSPSFLPPPSTTRKPRLHQ